METINIGDQVQSFDFGRDVKDCYVEGTVEEIGRLLDWQSCNVYKIKCTKKIFGGKKLAEHEEYYYPPVNGTSSLMGPTDFVTKI